MPYIIIENFYTPTIVTDVDGEVLWFDTIDEANLEKSDCQNGTVVELERF